MEIKKLTKPEEILKYVSTFNQINGYSIPSKYFLDNPSCIRAIVSDSGKVYGGYALVSNTSRSLQQVPGHSLSVIRYATEDMYKIVKSGKTFSSTQVVEFTGYFMKSKKKRFALTAYLLLDVFLLNSKWFAYSYTSSNKKLKKYYGHGNPVLVYDGVPRKLDGHPVEGISERVELLTKFGILKVFLARVYNKHMRWSIVCRR